MRHAIVRNGIIENVVEWDGESSWSPPEGTQLHQAPNGLLSIGWQWNNGSPIDPAPLAEAPGVPQEVSSGQIIKALAELGWLDAVDAAVAQAGPLEQRLWARASRFPRDDAMVNAIGAAIGKTSQELDDMFRLAAAK
jgi:hypothetical protein